MVCKLVYPHSVFELSAVPILAWSGVGCLDFCMCCVLSQFIVQPGGGGGACKWVQPEGLGRVPMQNLLLLAGQKALGVCPCRIYYIWHVRWEGGAPPWEKTTSLCPLCNTCHGSTAQLMLIKCPN